MLPTGRLNQGNVFYVSVFANHCTTCRHRGDVYMAARIELVPESLSSLGPTLVSVSTVRIV